jgi:hypothetical protein
MDELYRLSGVSRRCVSAAREIKPFVAMDLRPDECLSLGCAEPKHRATPESVSLEIAAESSSAVAQA